MPCGGNTVRCQRGTLAGIETLWRFFERHRITRKKRQHTPQECANYFAKAGYDAH